MLISVGWIQPCKCGPRKLLILRHTRDALHEALKFRVAEKKNKRS